MKYFSKMDVYIGRYYIQSIHCRIVYYLMQKHLRKNGLNSENVFLSHLCYEISPIPFSVSFVKHFSTVK